MSSESNPEEETETGAETETDAESEAGSGRETEVLEGYVIDNGCVRKNAREDLLEKARTHTSDCALMGHCVESGYSLVDEGEGMAMLDAEATPNVVHAVEDSDEQEGIRLRVERERRDGQMQTVSVEEVRE